MTDDNAKMPPPTKVVELTDEAIAAATGLPLDKVREERQRRASAQRAAVAALPGPVADAFDPQPAIKVGPRYEVRAFTDRDFWLLQKMGHPLHRMVSGEPLDGLPVLGEESWRLCFVMTRASVREAVAAFKAGKLDEGAEEFSELQARELALLQEAILTQLNRYWSPMLRYEADDGEGAKKKSGSGPTPARMASAG